MLAEELHFGDAAARLGIAQPPLSQQIRRLEDKVGHPLFHRTPAGVTLTPVGRELLPAAQRALADLTAGLAAARAVGSGRAGRLRIGFAASLALTVLPGLLQTFRHRYPDVHLDIHEMTSAPQLAALHEQAIDIGLLREPPVDEPALDFRTVLTEPFVAVLPTAHPLAPQRTVHLADLADSPSSSSPRVGPQLHDQIIGLCTAAGFAPASPSTPSNGRPCAPSSKPAWASPSPRRASGTSGSTASSSAASPPAAPAPGSPSPGAGTTGTPWSPTC